MKVLVVEDELLIGMDLVMLLQEWGYTTSGPHRSVNAALSAIEADAPDLAILDVNLGNGETSLPVAAALRARGAPFAFLSGYDPARYAGADGIGEAPHLRKPVADEALRDLLVRLAAKGG